MKVVYSIGTKLAGGGIGNIAYHAALGLHRLGLLARVLCGAYTPNNISQDRICSLGILDKALRRVATFDSTNWIWYAQSVFYDRWAARQIEQADVCHVWS